MHVVTGSAGFIGSSLVTRLTQQGIPVLCVDATKDQFLDGLGSGLYEGRIDAVLHQGACSDTLETDERYMLENNYTYSKRLLAWCQKAHVPFIYASSASVYGAGTHGFSVDRNCERPLNIYAYSKFLLDQHVRSLMGTREAQIVGLRYFNVYGPGESHKGRMASVAYQAYQQFKTEGKVELFEGDYQRDFIYIDDVVSVVEHFLANPCLSGIFNVGTGRAESFNAVATAVINAHVMPEMELSTSQMVQAGLIAYKPIPDALVGRYQPYTRADITGLRNAGYTRDFLTVREGVQRYVRELNAAKS